VVVDEHVSHVWLHPSIVDNDATWQASYHIEFALLVLGGEERPLADAHAQVVCRFHTACLIGRRKRIVPEARNSCFEMCAVLTPRGSFIHISHNRFSSAHEAAYVSISTYN
jgi:hypothetical protein